MYYNKFGVDISSARRAHIPKIIPPITRAARADRAGANDLNVVGCTQKMQIHLQKTIIQPASHAHTDDIMIFKYKTTARTWDSISGFAAHLLMSRLRGKMCNNAAAAAAARSDTTCGAGRVCVCVCMCSRRRRTAVTSRSHSTTRRLAYMRNARIALHAHACRVHAGDVCYT